MTSEDSGNLEKKFVYAFIKKLDAKNLSRMIEIL